MKCPACGYENAQGVQVCNSCGEMLSASLRTPGVVPRSRESKFELDKYVIRQKFLTLTQYYVTDDKDERLFAVERRLRSWGMGDVLFYDDEKQTGHALRVVREGLIDAFSRFRDEDADGHVVGYVRGRGFASLLLRTWSLLDSQGKQIGSVAREHPLAAITDLGLLRHAGFRFFIGDSLVARLTLHGMLRPYHVLDLTFDAQRRFDRRLALGVAVLLDTAARW